MAALDEQIRQWDDSGCLAENIAADLAIGIRASRVTTLPSSRSIATEWDASERTARRAKKLLAKEDIVRRDSTGRYYLP